MRFFLQFLRNPTQIGAIAPSSQYLAREMVRRVDFDAVNSIVEYGPGFGSFSREILRRKKSDCDYFALELNEKIYTLLSEKMPELTLFQDSAANVGKYLSERGRETTDVVFSGLPWAAFPENLQDELLDATLAALAPGGMFVTFAYLQGLLLPAGKRFKKKLDAHFSSGVTSSVVWRNLPPAVVYHYVK